MERCQICGKRPEYEGMVHLTVGENEPPEIMCKDCYNKYASDMYGIDNYTDFEKEKVFTDCDGIEHSFIIEKTIHPISIGWEAKEYLDDENIGYSFEVYQEFDESSINAINRLYKKIEKGLSKKFIEKSESLGREFFTFKDNVAEGRIEWDDNYDGEAPKLVIDGKEFTLHDFGKMMMSCEGWNFRLEIIEPTEWNREDYINITNRVNYKYIELNDKMQLGYKYLHEENYTEVIKTWLVTWNILMDEMKKVSAKTFKEFDDVFNGTQFVTNWVGDFEDCLYNIISISNDAEIKDFYGKKRIYLNEQILNFLEEDDDLSAENANRAIAETYFTMGDIKKGEELFEAYLSEDPNWGWGWIGWSDQYWICNRENADFKRGEQLLLKALNNPGIRDREDIEERLLDLYSESGETEKFEKVNAMLNNKNKVSKKIKIGRNEPCPCGSGKKYKKCCGA